MGKKGKRLTILHEIFDYSVKIFLRHVHFLELLQTELPILIFQFIQLHW